MNYRAVAGLLLVVSLLPVAGCDKATPVAPSGTILTISANPSQIALNGTSTITVVGRKPDGNPLNPGTEIRLTAERGTIASIVTVDSSGTATTTFHADGRSGDVKVSAATGGGDAKAETSITVGNGAKTITLQPTPTTLPSTGGDVSLLAVIRDSSGQLLPNQGVNFTTDLGTLASGGKTVNTNSQGVAKDTLRVSSTDLLNNATAVHVTVQSAGSDGALVSASATIQVVTGRPVAHFTYDAPGSDKRQVQFHNMSTGVGTLTYQWDFGDGSAVSNEQNPLHTYTADKQYTVQLTVTDSNNNASVTSATFTIPLATGGNSTP